ncbi:MAG: FMN-dependent NADH-azoreductase [Aestuariibacter sp.]
MTNVLIINSSLNSNHGNSNKLTQTFAQQLGRGDNLEVNALDLSAIELPHLSSEEMQAWMTPASERSKEQKLLAALSDGFIEQVKAADIIVVGMPMYNFGVPSVFKAWIDRIARAGITFKYTPDGPIGLLDNKKVFVLAARGGMYQGTVKDSQTQYLKDVFQFIGIEQLEFVYAEGLAMGEASYDNAFLSANEKIIELIDSIAA